MSKDHADYLTDEQIAAEVDQMMEDIRAGKKSEDEIERDAYFNDPANAAEIDAMLARMALVEALYKARHDAGLTQKQLAEKSGLKQTYIAQIEKGRKNLTFSTILKYAQACGKRINVTLL